MSVRWIPWSAAHLELFDMAQPTWRAPTHMKTTVNPKRDRLTCQATFRRPDGMSVMLVSRCRKSPEGTWFSVSERAEFRVGVSGPLSAVEERAK